MWWLPGFSRSQAAPVLRVSHIETRSGYRLRYHRGPRPGVVIVSDTIGVHDVASQPRMARSDEETEVEHEKRTICEDKTGCEHSGGGRVSLRGRADGNRFSSFLGLARSFRCESA